LWQRHLAAAAAPLTSEELDALAQRFHLTPGQISHACAPARARARRDAAARTETAPSAEPTLHHLMVAARAQSGHALAKLARKLAPKYRWTDIVLPEDQGCNSEICVAVHVPAHGVRGVGFGESSPRARACTCCSQPPGTGKTMAAEVIANELGLDL
jgi:SpoVK/Ycf46/Vps4 family AAA+-type ATPase